MQLVKQRYLRRWMISRCHHGFYLLLFITLIYWKNYRALMRWNEYSHHDYYHYNTSASPSRSVEHIFIYNSYLYPNSTRYKAPKGPI